MCRRRPNHKQAWLLSAHPETLSRVELIGRDRYSNAKLISFAEPLARLIELGSVDVASSSDMQDAVARSTKRSIKSFGGCYGNLALPENALMRSAREEINHHNPTYAEF